MMYGEISSLNIGSEGESQSSDTAFHLQIFLNFISIKRGGNLAPTNI